MHFGKTADLPLDPYLVGALLGDGDLGSVPYNCPRITTVDKEIVQEFERLLPDYCVLSFDGNCGYRIVDVLGRQGQGVKSRARQIVLRSGIAGHGSPEKFIPD